MDSIFYKGKYSKYKSKYLESKKFVGLNGNLVEYNDLNLIETKTKNTNNNNNNNIKKYNNNHDYEHNILTGGNKIIKLIRAIAFFNTNKIKGTVIFDELSNDLVNINVYLTGFEPNTTHGFHVHESGDLSKGCDSMCAHFNPYNQTHGGRDDMTRHVGDLGNIVANSDGIVQMEFTDHLIKLRGDEANIIGRGLIIHADSDDCGKTSHELSKTTGNSGKRIACAIIGYASTCNK
jgi:Cu-Zn family superoxide dismutase